MKVQIKMKHHDYTIIDTVCPECKHNIILRDNTREETYCTRCGLIIQDNTLTLISNAINEAQRKDKFIRSLWKKKIIKH